MTLIRSWASTIQWRAEGVRTVRRPRASILGGIQGASFRKNVGSVGLRKEEKNAGSVGLRKEDKNVVSGA